MLQVTVKTLDSQNHSFSVPDESTVKEFKEQIAPVLNITVDKQRLIFCGKVLKDDKKLSEYDVDGKVIHVVQSLPPQGNTTSSSSSSTNTSTGSGSRGGRDAAGFLLGAFSIPQDLVDPTQVQNIVHDVVSGMGEIGRNATVMSRASDDGTVDVHINLGRVPVSVPMQSEAQLRMNRVQTMLIRANHLLDTLEDGANSNNGNVADSSSQTENGNSSNESENLSMESESGNSSTANDNSLSSTLFENVLSGTNISNAEITSEISVDVPNDLAINPERFRFEGLAHAAQAAISAAFATAAAAARAAATSVSNPGNNVNPVPLDLRTVAPEPMEDSSSETPISDFMETGMAPEDNIIIDPIPPDNEPSSTQSEAKSEPKNDATPTQSNAPSQSTDLPTGSSNTSASTHAPGAATNPRRPRTAGRQVQPSVQTLANLLDEVIRFNGRLLPHLERVRDLIRSDSPLSGRPCADAQRLFSRISQMLHFLSHAFHSLSDLHVNFTHSPPRSPRVRIISSASSSLLQGLPMQAQISISTSSGPSPSSVSSTTTTANNSRNDTTPNTNAEVRPTPQPATQPSTNTSTATDPPTPSPRNQNPLVFMEVSPTVTIDSIASMMAPQLNSSAPLFNVLQIPEGSFTSSGDTQSTPNLSFTVPPPQPTSQTETNADTSRSSQRTSAPNLGPPLNGQTPTFNMPSLRNLIPVPLTSMGSLHTFDSGLPCHSVWALEPSRRRHNAGGSRTPAAHQPPNLMPNFPGRQEDQLQQVISNIVMSLLNHTHMPAQGNGTPGVAVFSTRATDIPREGSAFTSANGQPNRDRVSRSERSSSSPIRIHPRSASAGASADVSSMRHMLNNIGLVNKNIADVFPSDLMRNTSFDLLGGFFWFLANNITFQDLIDMGERNFNSLSRIQPSLQTYLREKVFQSENPQTSDYNRVVEQILTEIRHELRKFIRIARVGLPNSRSYIDAFEALLRKNLKKVFDALLSRTCAPNFNYGQHVADVCKEIFDQFLQLHSRYSHIDALGLEPIFRTLLEPLTELILPAYQRSVRVLVLSSLFRLTFGSRNVPTSSTGEGSHPAASSSTKTDKPNEEKKPESNQRPPMREISFSDFYRDGPRQYLTARNSGSEQSEDGAAPTLAAFARIAEQTTAILRGNNRTNDNRSTGVNVTEVVIRPETWHSSIPQDWVPIITRDVQRQRRQAPQAPFSNAYLSGMPSKRRKIMTNDAPTLLEHSQSTLSDMLLQAISSADVKPITSIEEVKSEASQDNVLQSSFNEHMKHAIQERLQRDLDYCSEKFPNSEKYYNI